MKGNEEKLDVINRHENTEQVVDICHNVRLAHSSISTIHDNADRITESPKSETKVFVQQDYHSPIRMKCTKYCGCGSLTFVLH